MTTNVLDISNAKISSQLKRHTDQFEIIKSKGVYCLSISISVGCSDTKIGFKDLGFSDEEISAKSQALIKAPTITVFPKLREAANKLNFLKKQIQSQFLVNGNRRWWFVLEDRIDPLVERLNNTLLPTCEQLKAEIIASYELNKRDYESRLTKGIADFILPEDREEVVQKYLNFFPTISDIESDFGVEIDGPIKVSSILEDAEVAEKAAIISLHQQWKKTIANNLEGSLQETTDEIYQLIADLLEEIEKKPALALSNKAKFKFEEALSRLHLLVDFNDSLKGILEQSQTIANKGNVVAAGIGNQVTELAKEYLQTNDDFQALAGHSRFKTKITKICEQLHQTIDLSAEGKGHRHLARFMSI